MATETKRRRGRPDRPPAGLRRSTVIRPHPTPRLSSRGGDTDGLANALELIQHGVADVKAGRTTRAELVFVRLRRRHSIPR